MAGSDSENDVEKSQPTKRLRGAGKGTRSSKTKSKKDAHNISEESSEGEDTGKEKSVRGGSFSARQMKDFATMISATMGSAFAQASSVHVLAVLQFPPKSSQDGRDLSNVQHESSDENEPDEIDDYDKSLENMLGDQEVVGPALSEKVARVLGKCLGTALDEKMVKEKRELYPHPLNIENFSVPRLNPEIYKRISGEHQFGDKALLRVKSYLVASMTSVGQQAELALKVRSWYNRLKEEERECFPNKLGKMAKTYVRLMDTSVLMTRAMWETTSLRRKIIKNELIEPYKSLVDDEKYPASPAWLVGNDVHSAIKKAMENAALANKITAKSSWSGGNKRSQCSDRGGFRPGFGSGQHNRSSSGGNHGRQDSGNQTRGAPRGRGNGGNRGRNFDACDGQDFYRWDSR